MKDRQYNDQMILDKKTNNELQNTTKKNKYIEHVMNHTILCK